MNPSDIDNLRGAVLAVIVMVILMRLVWRKL